MIAKVFIAIPTRDLIHAHTAYCLQETVRYCENRDIQTTVSFNMGTLICNQREALTKEFLESDSTHIMWIDSDMMFPANIVETLLSHSLPVVACSYSTRGLPLKSVSYTDLTDWESWIDSATEPLISVQATGMGMMLVEKEVLVPMSSPRFEIKWMGEDHLGEDFDHCLKITELGYSIVIDTKASAEILHIGSHAFSFKALKNTNISAV